MQEGPVLIPFGRFKRVLQSVMERTVTAWLIQNLFSSGNLLSSRLLPRIIST
jgi:hypothetical protein